MLLWSRYLKAQFSFCSGLPLLVTSIASKNSLKSINLEKKHELKSKYCQMFFDIFDINVRVLSYYWLRADEAAVVESKFWVKIYLCSVWWVCTTWKIMYWSFSYPFLSLSNVLKTWSQNSDTQPAGKHLLYIFMKDSLVRWPSGQSCLNPLYHSWMVSSV